MNDLRKIKPMSTLHIELTNDQPISYLLFFEVSYPLDTCIVPSG